MAERMQVEHLRRYGKGIDDMPKRVLVRQSGVMLGELRRRYGTRGLVRLVRPMLRERRRLERDHAEDMDRIRRDFGSGAVTEAVGMSSLFLVLVPIEGREGAYEVVRSIFERIAPASMAALYQVEDLARCEGDPFENFKRFHLAMFDGSQDLFPNTQADEGDRFTSTVSRCGNVEAFMALGAPELGRLGCDHDLAGYPTICDRFGFEFRRPTTIAKGSDRCRFRFYRAGTAPDTEEIEGVPVHWTPALNR